MTLREQVASLHGLMERKQMNEVEQLRERVRELEAERDRLAAEGAAMREALTAMRGTLGIALGGFGGHPIDWREILQKADTALAPDAGHSWRQRIEREAWNAAIEASIQSVLHFDNGGEPIMRTDQAKAIEALKRDPAPEVTRG